MYSTVRENVPALFKALTGPRLSSIVGFLNYELFLGRKITGNNRFFVKSNIKMTECFEPFETLDTPRKIFERKIRYWETRPMPPDADAVVSPADARVLMGSFCNSDAVFVKNKFFNYEQLLGRDKTGWLKAFAGADYAIFRLTPDKYHYNHVPVAGKVVDFYEIEGRYHSCNPGAVIAMVTPYSMNKRIVTIIDSDVPGGTQAGLVAMIEVVACMIGDIIQCYSEEQYSNPQTVVPGMFLKKGSPKSLYRPGSSTDILLFQKDRIRFADDLVKNLHDGRVISRFTRGFGEPLAETDVKARSFIGKSI
jgi:phosphatidylserine decarboxylase